MVSAIPTLRIARYQLRFKPGRPVSFRGYAGSAWRGAFGHALKKTVCITKAAQCSSCLLYRSCIYPEVFETPLPDDSPLRNSGMIPHPFIVGVPWRCEEPQTEVTLNISLFGRATRHLAYIVHAFSRLGTEGIQKSGPLELCEVRQETTLGSNDWHTIYSGEGQIVPIETRIPSFPPTPDWCRLSFETPLRLRHLNTYVTPDRFHFSDLVRNLLGRVSALQRFHAENQLMADFVQIVELSRSMEFRSLDVRWVDWLRFSSRQQEKLAMGGLMGTAEVGQEALTAFWPLLWFGQFTHAGKGTSMGLGAYRVDLESRGGNDE